MLIVGGKAIPDPSVRQPKHVSNPHYDLRIGMAEIAKRELGLSIADHGRWEEFHQKRGNYTMYDYHKSKRLLMEAEYRATYLPIHRG